MGVSRSGIALVSLIVLTLSGCDTNLGGDGAPSQETEQTGGELAAIPLPPDRPGPTMSDKPVRPGGRHRMHSVSSEVVEGQPYIYELDGRCGLGHRVDFDGRLWDAVDKPDELRGQRTTGTMTLVNDQLAEFTTDDGIRIRFIRHLGKKFAVPCD